MQRRTEGFTLVEVLVALLVLALAMTAWQWRITAQLDGAAHLRDKTLALWVADNQLRYLQLWARLDPAAAQPVQGGVVTLAGRTWYWQATPLVLTGAADTVGTTTLEEGPLPLQVGVSPLDARAAREQALVTLGGVLDAKSH